MKKQTNHSRLTLIFCTLFALSGVAYFYCQNWFGPNVAAAEYLDRPEMEDEMETEGEEGGEAKMAANIERELHEFYMTRDPALDAVPRERLIPAWEYTKKKWDKAQEKTAVPNIDWEERGPNNVAGRTRALLVDASDATGNTVFAGSAGGGLWKTTNFLSATPVWTNTNAFFANLSTTCIVQDPSDPDIIYVGTGEGFGGSGAIRGLGIWKTTNGGATWFFLSSTINPDFFYVQDLLINTNGHLFAATTTNVHRSTNGGTSWAPVLGGPAADLEMAADGDLYATLGFNSGSGVIVKSDFATWGGNTGDWFTWGDITPAPNTFERIELATAPSDANRIYAVCEGAGTNDASHFFRSTDGGTTWTSLGVPTICDQGGNPVFTRGQAWYDLIIAVDPNNPQTLFMGGIDGLRSTNGGNTWTQMTDWANNNSGFCPPQPQYPNVHADHHAYVYMNGNSSQLIMGTDGGIYYTANATATLPTFTNKNTGYNVTQFYACAMHPNSGSNYFLAGSQDNGTQKFTSAGLGNTTEFSGGDGGFCHIDQDNPNVQIGAYVRNQYRLSTNGGANVVSRNFNMSGRFINPTDYDNTANMLYAANGATDYLRWNDPSTGGSSFNIVSAGFLSQISAITCVGQGTNLVWMGDGIGNLYGVQNAHTNTPTVATFPSPNPGAYISSIAMDPNNIGRLLVTFSNYGVVSVYGVDIVAGVATWSNIEGNLPDIPVRWGMFNPNNTDQALLATELGVWSTDNFQGANTDWDPTNLGLANVRVDMLQHRPSDMTVAAATHGRGLFTSLLSPNATLPNPSSCGMNLSIPDNSCTAAHKFPINVTNAPGTSLGTDVELANVVLSIEHTYDADLDIKLYSPSGVVVELSTDNGGSGDNYGAPACNSGVTVFSMAAATSITAGTAPFIGEYIPEGDLADFNDGSNPNGIWFLEICDDAGSDVGQLEHVNLDFTMTNPTACQAARTIPDNSCTSAHNFRLNVSGAPGTQLGTNVWLTHVKLIIEHTYDADLDITLFSPNGVGILLSSDNGGSGNNYGDPNDGTCTSVTDFTMGATIPITAGTAPFIGSFLPESSFAILDDGSNPNGVWTLQICDDAGQDVGQFEYAKLEFSNALPVPGCANLTSPVNGATNVPVNSDLTWAAATNGPTGYRLSIGTTPGGTQILNNANLGNVTTYNPPADFPAGANIYVRITPYNGYGDASGCAEQSFTTAAALPPSCTNLTSPVNGATNVPVNSDLTWAAATNGPTGYNLSIGTTPGGTQILNNVNVGNVTTYNPAADFPFGATIYVTITPFSGNGPAIGCMEESFSTEAAPLPSCTNLTSPVNGATNVPVNSNLTWATASNGPTGYRLSIGTTPGGTEILNNADLGNVASYNPPIDFPYSSTIYVTIIPYNGSGDATGCAEESFSTGTSDTPTSCLPTYLTPCTSEDYIDNMILNTISNTGTGCGTPGPNNYTDYTGMSTDLDAGTSYTISVKPGPAYGQTFVALVDFNQDDFFTVDEYFFIGYADGGIQIDGTISVPSGAAAGPTLLRVICRFNDEPFPFSDICGTIDYGEVEDYTVNIDDGCADDLIVNGNPITPGAYYADNSITSDGIVSLGSVEFYALASILLSPEFEVELGAEFLAETGIGCTIFAPPASPEDHSMAAVAGAMPEQKTAAPWLLMLPAHASPKKVLAKLNLTEATIVSWHLEDLMGNRVGLVLQPTFFEKGVHQMVLGLPNIGLHGICFLVGESNGQHVKLPVSF